MKKLLLSLLVVGLFAGCCQRAEAMSSSSIRSEIRCEAGYTFLYSWVKGGNMVTVTQIFEQRIIDPYKQPPQPMKCGV